MTHTVRAHVARALAWDATLSTHPRVSEVEREDTVAKLCDEAWDKMLLDEVMGALRGAGYGLVAMAPQDEDSSVTAVPFFSGLPDVAESVVQSDAPAS